MVEHAQHLHHRQQHNLAEGSHRPNAHQRHSSSAPHSDQHQQQIQHTQAIPECHIEPITAACDDSSICDSAQRPALHSSLRWLQLCLLLLFAQDVFCFSLGYPFLPQYLADHGHGGAGVAVAFGIYGMASIVTLLLLLLIHSSRSRSSSSGVAQQPAAKYWLIVTSTSLAAAAGAVNAVMPESYAILLSTKAVQGAASALYFVYTLSLVAMVFPAVYKTQAMAFVSAGLTLGDALGPVVGGITYQAKGLQQALGMQPIASGLALLALLLLLLAWPNRKRPWRLAPHQQQQQQQHRNHITEQQQCWQRFSQHRSDVEHATSCLTTPLLQRQQAATCSSCNPGHLLGSRSAASSHRAAATSAADSAVASPSLLQLLRTQGILSLCMLALMCQAARTAIDLLLPMMLQDSVQPGVIGLLFAGEAVGSVGAPFCVDWLLHRQTRQITKDKQQQQASESNLNESAAAGTAGATADHSNDGHQLSSLLPAPHCRSAEAHEQQHHHHQQQQQQCSDGGVSDSGEGNAVAANRLLFISAVGMAVCCCLVLTAWELPVVGCRLVHHNHRRSNSSGSSGRLRWHVPAWLCTHTETFNTAAGAAASASAAGPAAVVSDAMAGGVIGTEATSSSTMPATSNMDASFAQQSLQHIVLGGLRLGSRGSGSPWRLLNLLARSSDGVTGRLPSRNEAAADKGPFIAAQPAVAATSVAPAGIAFGLLQLLLTGLVLMVLGGCHSSCETLIYTVLTDLVTATSTHTSSRTAPMHKTSKISKAGSREACVTAEGCLVEHVDMQQDHTIGVCRCKNVGTYPVQAAPVDSSRGCPKSAMHDCQDARTMIGCACGTGSKCHVRDGSVTDDATEAVMVLYVLFWVAGFTVGAAVAGVPGSQLLGQQLTGCVTGLVLGIAALWSHWSIRTAATIFVSH